MKDLIVDEVRRSRRQLTELQRELSGLDVVRPPVRMAPAEAVGDDQPVEVQLSLEQVPDHPRRQ